MASKQVETAPSDVISPAEEKLDFDAATLRGKERFFSYSDPKRCKISINVRNEIQHITC